MTTKTNIIPPWKKELLLRRNALAKAVDPNASVIAEYLESNVAGGCSPAVQTKKMVVGAPPSEGVKSALSSSERRSKRVRQVQSGSSVEVEERRRLFLRVKEGADLAGSHRQEGAVPAPAAEVNMKKKTHAIFSREVDHHQHHYVDDDEEEAHHHHQSVIFTGGGTNSSTSSNNIPAATASVTKKGEPGTATEPLSPQHPLLQSESHPSVGRRRPGVVTNLLQTSTFNSILSGMILASPAIVVTDQEESLLLMDKPRLPKASSSSLDSDDGSSSSSASSTEELRYGPGFVSRLKSRYMRSALRSSHFNNLRRTASLEDFLEKEDEVEEEEEEEEEQPPLLPRRSWAPPRGANAAVTAKKVNNQKKPSSHPLRSRDSMKRCKSVEVLSRNRLPSSSDSIPPPLPPKTASSHRTPLDLNATKGFVPDRCVVLRERKPKELPAQDIVKQTRKLFESKSISSSPNVIISSHSKAPTLRKREDNPPALPLKSISAFKSSNSSSSTGGIDKPSPPRGGILPNSSSSSKNPLELPPKQIGIIRPITRPTSNSSTSFVHEQNLKNKASAEVPLVSDKKINKNVQTNSSSSSSEQCVAFLHKKSTLKSVSPVSSSTKEEQKGAKEMCEFKSIVLKEVKKELLNSGGDSIRSSSCCSKPQNASSLNSKSPHEPESVKSRLSSPPIDDGIGELQIEENEEEEVVSEEDERRRDLKCRKKDSQTGIVESKNITFRDSWKARNEGKNTLVFNFINSKKDVSHIENDGLDFTKRNKKLSKPGVILLDSVISDESTDDDGAGLIKQQIPTDDEDEEELNRPPSPCSIVFIGGNLISGKSSLRSSSSSSKSSDKKMNISFSSSLEEVFEYPSFESSLRDDEALSKNGGLGSYTPSKNQLSETPFQLGVSRTPSSSSSSSSSSKDKSKSSSKVEEEDQVLRPVEDAVSWSGSSSSSDILF